MKLKLQKGFDLSLDLDGKETIFKIYLTPQDKLQLQKLGDKISNIRNKIQDNETTTNLNKSIKEINKIYDETLTVVFGDRKGELDSFLYTDGEMDTALVEYVLYPIIDKSIGASLSQYDYVSDENQELN